MEKEKLPQRPLTFVIAKWYGYIFVLFFVLYGGVKIVLGIMDHNYEGFPQSLIFLLAGILLSTIVFAFRDGKAWGWYGMIAMHGLAMLGSLVQAGDASYLVLAILSAGVLALLLAPPTRECVFDGS